VVFDDSMPAASASITRKVTVVSPCPPHQIYCPGTSIACASTPCGSRDSITNTSVVIMAPQLHISPAFSVTGSGVIIRTDGELGVSLEVDAICNRPELIPVDICLQEGGLKGEEWVFSSATGRCFLTVWTPISLAMPPAARMINGDCELESIMINDCMPCWWAGALRGHCGDPGSHDFVVGALDSVGQASQPLQVKVIRSSLRARAMLYATIALEDVVDAAHSNELVEVLSGSSASSTLAQAFQVAVYASVLESKKCTVDAENVVLQATVEDVSILSSSATNSYDEALIKVAVSVALGVKPGNTTLSGPQCLLSALHALSILEVDMAWAAIANATIRLGAQAQFAHIRAFQVDSVLVEEAEAAWMSSTLSQISSSVQELTFQLVCQYVTVMLPATKEAGTIVC
jgi:hypothetical protein